MCFAAVLLGVRTEIVSADAVTVIRLGAFAVPLCTLGLLIMVNFFNFMDGIDGLAIGQTLVAALVLAGAALLLNVSLVALLAAALAGVAAGFLPFNWNPAKSFMGDSGSYFCGGTLGGLLIFGQQSGVPLLLVALASAVFLADAAVTLGLRLVSRKPVWQAHRTHVYQRLVLAGWSHARVTTLYMAIGAISGIAALLYLAKVRGQLPL
jgi:UDP-N-acetylmuramyl pentapeptide phosphotransferase/UDP-N-acetylglucosamine-1-phosphate transferase